MGGPLDGAKMSDKTDVLFIKFANNRIAIYYKDKIKKPQHYNYYTIASESDLEDITDIMLDELN
jgi:hypothetical protein